MSQPVNIAGQWTFTLIYGPEYQNYANMLLHCDANFAQNKNNKEEKIKLFW
ncbi:MAG TPA: hypothetical protein VKG26_05625 [Bacteroidia bacterium]|nr:hypothetical protein [Bacteroidia bacterium]